LTAFKKILDSRHSDLIESQNRFSSPGCAESCNEAEARDESSSQSAELQDILLSREGDGDAYRRLIERHQQQVSSMMWRFSRDPDTHEELVQSVFVEAYLSIKTYRAKAPFIHWLSRIATRTGYLYWKNQARERAHPTVALEEWQKAMDAPSDEMESGEAAELLYDLLEQLPPRDRLVLTLRYIEDRSVKDTSKLMGLSQAMVKVQT